MISWNQGLSFCSVHARCPALRVEREILAAGRALVMEITSEP